MTAQEEFSLTDNPHSVPGIAGVILAAGQAQRMGRPKQLLLYRGKTLIGHVLSEAVQVLSPVVLVVGAYADEVRAAASEATGGLHVQCLENMNWKAGLASSIRAGVDFVLKRTDAEAVLLMAGDQPFIAARHLRAMCAAFSSAERNPAPDIVAAEYAGTLGIPAVFGRSLFPRLLTLTGDKGARALMQDATLRVTPFPLPEAAVDVDTPEDAAALA